MQPQPSSSARHSQLAESALGRSEAIKSAILETALDCIVTIDHEGRVVDFNPAAERTFGYTRAEALGREMGDLVVPPAYRELHRAGLRRAVDTGKNKLAGRRIELTAMRRSGEEFPVELAITRIPGGDRPLFTGHIRDITERKEAEQRLTAQYAVARVLAEANSLAEAAPRILRAVGEGLKWDLGAIWTVHRADTVLRCVDVWHVDGLAVMQFVAQTRHARLGRGVGLPGRIWLKGEAQWIRDVTRDMNFPRAPIAASCGLHAAFGFPIRLGDDVLGVIEFFSREIRQPNAEILAMFDAVGSQIGQFIERKQAEEKLRDLNRDLEGRINERTAAFQESEKRYRTVAEHTPAAIVVLDADTGKFIDGNENALRLFGLPRAELLRVGPAELSPAFQPDGRLSAKAARQEIQKALGGATTVFDWTHRGAGGRDIPCEVRVTRMPAAGRNLVIGAITDITARKQAEAELRAALDQEKELSRLKSNFVNVVSHEFRTPLGVIVSSTDIIETYFDRLRPEQRRDHLQDIRHATRQMTALMEEVLLLGRVDSGKMECRPETTDLRSLCRRLVDEHLSANNRKCPIELTLRNVPARARCDEALLRHIFANLLSNAVKYSPQGKPVQFSVRRENCEAVFKVQDEGIGIPLADQPRLFEAFHRGQNVGEIPGTGLGMVIVKRCVDLHGGTIELSSAPGRGTTVEVRLRLFEELTSDKPARKTKAKRKK